MGSPAFAARRLAALPAPPGASSRTPPVSHPRPRAAGPVEPRSPVVGPGAARLGPGAVGVGPGACAPLAGDGPVGRQVPCSRTPAAPGGVRGALAH